MDTGFLWEILSQPTAPFREHFVLMRLKRELAQNKVPYFEDPAGNLILGVESRAEYLKRLKGPLEEPVRVFVAHTDHPGFHGVKWIDSSRLEIKWHGGSPIAHLEDAAVWLGDDSGFTHLQGHLTQVELVASGRGISKAQVLFTNVDAKSHYEKADRLYGSFRFRAPVWEENGRVYTKAADDLVGAFVIATTAIELWKNKKHAAARKNFLGVLTRAEEVGFVGAIEHFELGWLSKSKRPVLVVSLETSRTLPGAEFGKGPVVRLGDRNTVFDPAGLQILAQIATKVLPGRHQRRIMDGGSCEATAAIAYGLPAIGMSIPLGNYHNQCFEGGPDASGPNGPAPEFVDLSDVKGMIELCQGLMAKGVSWKTPWQTKRKELQKLAKGYRPLMKSGRIIASKIG